MTAKEVITRLKKEGWLIEEGAKHTKAISKSGKVIPIPRHTKDLTKATLKSIEKSSGIKF